MQEQMDSMNDSGEFQEVVPNYSGRLSYVSSQPAMIPSSRSMLNRDKRLPLDTWNTSGLQENVSGNPFPATEKRAFVLSHDYLLIFALRLREFVVLELSSFLPFRAYFVFEYLEVIFLS